MKHIISNLLFIVGFGGLLIFAAGADTSPMRVVIPGMVACLGILGVSCLLDPSKLN